MTPRSPLIFGVIALALVYTGFGITIGWAIWGH